jgi:hypothetical protein
MSAAAKAALEIATNNNLSIDLIELLLRISCGRAPVLTFLTAQQAATNRQRLP